MTVDLSQFRQAFLEESSDNLAAMESHLLALETSTNQQEELHAIFRAAHSIKGNAASLGFSEIAEFTHHLESILDKLRSGLIPVTKERLDLLLRASDVVGALLSQASREDGSTIETGDLVAQLKASGGESEPGAAGPRETGAKPTNTEKRRVAVHVRPASEFFHTGLDPILLMRDLSALGEVASICCDTTAVPALADLVPDQCHVTWSLVLETAATEELIREVFVFVEDVCAVEVVPLADSERVLVSDDKDTAVPVAVGATEKLPQVNGSRSTPTGSVLRIPAAKVDSLMDLVGELVIAQSMVRQLISEHVRQVPAVLQDAIDSIDRNTQELQTRVMGVRLVPVGSVLGRFPRVVRDLAGALGKEVELELEGNDTEIDKDVVEKLNDPLMHLIRNAVDHGVETVEERRAAGKSERGRVRIAACHVAGGVSIDISDDGRGLDLDRIRRHAEQRGLIAPSAELSVPEIQSLIFAPGFSTAEKVTEVSGRGVGMDVVKRVLEGLGGSIGISSDPGKGTQFSIKLPLTRAILDGLTLVVGRQVFVVPLLAVTESFRPSSDTVRTVAKHGEVVMLRGQALPLLRLSEVFGIHDAQPELVRSLVVVVESEGRMLGLVVDAVNGQAQIVVKNLDARFARAEGILGATILGSGEISLILDVPTLVRLGRGTNTRADTCAA